MVKLDQQEATKQFQTGWFHKVPRNLIFLKVNAWIMVAFDNDQVVGKSWRVITDNKVKSSCVTSICAVAIDTGSCNFSNEQFKIANHPKNWFNYIGFVQKLDNIRNKDGTYFDEVYDTHYQMLCHNLETYVPGISRTNEKTNTWHM